MGGGDCADAGVVGGACLAGTCFQGYMVEMVALGGNRLLRQGFFVLKIKPELKPNPHTPALIPMLSFPLE